MCQALLIRTNSHEQVTNNTDMWSSACRQWITLFEPPAEKTLIEPTAAVQAALPSEINKFPQTKTLEKNIIYWESKARQIQFALQQRFNSNEKNNNKTKGKSEVVNAVNASLCSNQSTATVGASPLQKYRQHCRAKLANFFKQRP